MKLRQPDGRASRTADSTMFTTIMMIHTMTSVPNTFHP